MAHDHDHAHHHQATLTQVNKAFITGIVLNAGFVVAEAIAGFATHSLSLLTDAGHNLSDVASLGLSLLAFRLAKMKPTGNYTYGYQKTTILAALTNAVILLIAIGVIVWEAIARMQNPEPLQGSTIAVVALIGIVINSVTAFLFFRQKNDDLNVKGAYLHLAADAAVSAGVVIGGVVMVYTGWYFLDTILSILIAVVIFISTWKLLKQTLRLSLDGIPDHIDRMEVEQAILKVPGVVSLHHMHIWAISTNKNALTAHLIIHADEAAGEIKKTVRHNLEHLKIDHCTLETETRGTTCADTDCSVTL